MKNIILTIGFLVGAFILLSCEEEGPQITLKSSVAENDVEELSNDSYTLNRENAGQVFETFSWTEPDFGFPASVTYTLQLDLSENNFSSPAELAVTDTLEAVIMVEELNARLLDMGLEPGEPVEVAVRVKSTINPNVEPVYSKIWEFTVTPYATVFPPIYMIGDALLGWDTNKAVEMRSIEPNVYQTLAEFHNGGAFRFFASPSWDADPQYNWDAFVGGNVDENLVNAEDGDTNIRFVGETGFYRITVNPKEKTITMSPEEKPTLYMIGDALQGWDLAKAVEMTWLRDGVFQATAEFTPDKAFRFFEIPDWSTGFANYPYFAEGEVDPLFENADDGDKNFRFIGEEGTYTITVNFYDLTVTLEQP